MVTVPWGESTEYRIYHIRTELGESLYVGQSKNAFRRFPEHAVSKGGNPDFARYLQTCNCDLLRVDMYTLTECEAATGEKGQDAVNVMESKLIAEFNPAFNRRKIAHVQTFHFERDRRTGFSCDSLPF